MGSGWCAYALRQGEERAVEDGGTDYRKGVRSRDGLLGKCESARLRNQCRGNRVVGKGTTTRGEISKGILLELLTRGEHGENTLDKATAALTGRAITGLAPLHGMAKAALSTIVRLRDFRNPHESP